MSKTYCYTNFPTEEEVRSASLEQLEKWDSHLLPDIPYECHIFDILRDRLYALRIARTK